MHVEVSDMDRGTEENIRLPTSRNESLLTHIIYSLFDGRLNSNACKLKTTICFLQFQIISNNFFSHNFKFEELL